MKPVENLGGYFFLFVLALVLWAALLVLKPYIVVLFLASILAIVLFPINSRLQQMIAKMLPKRWLRRQSYADSLAAIVSCLVVLVVVGTMILMVVIPLANYSLSTFRSDMATPERIEAPEGPAERLDELSPGTLPETDPATQGDPALEGEKPQSEPPGTALGWQKWLDTISQSMLQDNRYFKPVAEWSEQFRVKYLGGWNFREKIFDVARGLIGTISKFILDQTVTIVSRTGILVVNFSLMLFATYFFLRQGDAIVAQLIRLSPMSDEHELLILKRFGDVSRSAFFGTFLTSLVQGFLAAIPFAFFGYGYLIWALLLSFFSLIPVVGMAVIWVPFALFLFVIDKTIAGIVVLIWETLVGLVDNFLRPWILHKIGTSTTIPPLFMFFSLIGGVQAFGLLGLLLGPIIFNLAMTLLQIFETIYRDQLDSVRPKTPS